MKRFSILLLTLCFTASWLHVNAVHAEAEAHCGPLLETVDEILEVSDQLGIPEDVQQRVREHRDEARRHHEAGDDRSCVESIDRGLEIIEQGG